MRPDMVKLGMYGVALAASLGVAYWASMPVTDGDQDRVSIVSFDPKAIVSMEYKTKDTDVAVQKREDERYWVNYTKTEPPPKPSPSAVGSGSVSGSDAIAAITGLGSGSGSAASPVTPAVSQPVVTHEKFLANDKLDALAKSFSPLSALRVIGKVDDAQLAEFGLKDKDEQFSLKTSDGKSLNLILGKRGYGTKTRFAAVDDGAGGPPKVLLLDDDGFDNLEKANLRAYDRRLLGFEFADVTHAAIKTAAGKSKRMAHQTRDKSGELLWTDEEENAPPKSSYDSWMDRISKLRLAGFASDEEEKTLAAVQPYLSVAFEKQGKPVDALLFKKVIGADGKPAYWMYSDFLKAHAKMVAGRIEPIEKDVATVFGNPAPGG